MLEILKGKFITFEGGEGGGKSTQSKLLVEYLNKQGIEAIYTREPGGSEGGEEIRKVLVTGSANKWDGITELLLMYAARRDHTEKKIKPLLRKGVVVISDRYYDSTIAYQGYGHKLSLDKIKVVEQVTLEGFKPDITFILDLSVEQGMERANKRGEKNRFEDMKTEFHKRVREGFLEIAKQNPQRCKLVDVSKIDIQQVHEKIKKLLNI